MMKFLQWLCSRVPAERAVTDMADKLQMSIKTTLKCRYNAATRLKHQAKWSFFTTTLLSLGLVFIPLMQLAGVPLRFETPVLNAIQVFLAVAVLVFSLVIGTARNELRAEQLTDCGNRLKDLTRELDATRELNGGTVPADELKRFQSTYSMIVTDVENHERNDFRFAFLEMRTDYFVTGLPRLKLYLEAQLVRLGGFLLPTVLMVVEILIILDMMGVTSVFTPYFAGTTSTPETI